jgi:hypothetical protein
MSLLACGDSGSVATCNRKRKVFFPGRAFKRDENHVWRKRKRKAKSTILSY